MQSAGLEISQEKVSLLALKKKGQSFSVFSQSFKDLPEGTIVDGILKKPDIFTQYLMMLKKEGRPKKYTRPYVVIALPEEIVYLTIKSMPEIPQEQLHEALEINLSEFLPGKLDEIFWGYQLIEGKVKQEVILASVKRSILQDYLKAIAAAGFMPLAIEPSSLSIARTFKRLTKPSAILEFSNSHCLMVFVQNGNVNFSSSFDYVGQDVDKEVKKALAYFKAKEHILDLDIFIGGPKSEDYFPILEKEYGGSLKRSKDQILFSNLHLESNVLLGAAMRALMEQKEDRNLSLLAVGTAEGFQQRRALRFIAGITRLAIVTCLLFIIIFYGFWLLLTYLNNTTTSQLAVVSKTNADPQVSEISKNLTDLEPKFSYMQKVLASFSPIAPKLQAVVDSQPPNVSLLSITMAKDSSILAVTGSGENRDALALFKDNLEKSKAFTKVNFASTNVAEEKINFTLNLSLK